MNRQQRRRAAKGAGVLKTGTNRLEKSIIADMTADQAARHGLKPGQKFTMPGKKRYPNGTVVSNCKEGDETVFVCRIVPAQGPGA